MPSQLILRLTDTLAQEVEWLVLDNGQLSQGPQKTAWVDLPRLLGKSQTIVLVPTEQLNLCRAKVPPATAARLEKAIPFALEDQLIEDIGELHFALGPISKYEDIPVAIVKKTTMDAWAALFKQNLLFIDALLPDVLALPWQEGSWTVLITEHLAYVRTGACDGFACDLDMLVTLLELGLEESEAQKPEKLNVYSEQTNTRLIELEKLSNIIINTQILDMPAFVFLAQNLSNKPALNLLQGDYQANRELAEIKKRWLLAGGVAAAWLFVSASFAMTQFFYWEHKNNQLNDQIKTIYQKNFPQATTFDDPRLRMQNELQALQNQASGGHFLSLLGTVGEVLHSLAATSMQLKGLTFSTGSLVLELQVNNFAALQNLTGLLQQKGLTVKQDSATTNAQGVQAHLTITRGNSS